MRHCSFAGEFAQYVCQGVSLSGIAVLLMLLNRALAGCVNLYFLDSDQIVPNQALVQPVLEKIGEITLSRIYSHAETDAGLARGGRIKGGLPKTISSHSRPFGFQASIKAQQASEKQERLFLRGR
jgi:hypothetical protein